MTDTCTQMSTASVLSQDDETFYESSESFNQEASTQPHSAAAASEAGQILDQLIVGTPPAVTTGIASSSSAVRPKVTSYKAPRKSQRVKRKRIDVTKHCDVYDDMDYQDTLLQVERRLETKFTNKLGRIEKKFDGMLTSISAKLDKHSEATTKSMKQAIADLKLDMTKHVDVTVNKKVDEKMANIDAKIQVLTAEISSHKATLSQNAALIEGLDLEEVTNKLANVTAVPDDKTQKQVEEIQGKLDDLTAKLQEMNTTLSQQARKQEDLEFHSRKLNVIFEGVKVKEGESCKAAIERIIRVDMHLELAAGTVDVAHTLGPPVAGQTQPIIVRFNTVTNKSRVLENAAILKSHEIYIRPDYPISITEKRAYLAKSLKVARASDSEAKLVRDKLLYNKKLYTVDNIHEAGLGDETHTVYTDTQIRFYGYRSPFSNFYRSSFKLNGATYTCVEQALQAARAFRNRDRVAWTRIMSTTNPVRMKRLGKPYAPRNEREEDMERRFLSDAVYQKFAQNEVIRQKLLNTTDKKMMECNPYDQRYSTGLKMDDPKLDELDYTGGNIMGNILELVRQKLTR